jgi:hypothetical protein
LLHLVGLILPTFYTRKQLPFNQIKTNRVSFGNIGSFRTKRSFSSITNRRSFSTTKRLNMIDPVSVAVTVSSQFAGNCTCLTLWNTMIGSTGAYLGFSGISQGVAAVSAANAAAAAAGAGGAAAVAPAAAGVGTFLGGMGAGLAVASINLTGGVAAGSILLYAIACGG